MSWEFQIKDGTGQNYLAKVSKDHALYVTYTDGDLPPVGTASRVRYFQQKLNVVGDTADFDLNVNGAVTPVEFEIIASEDYDIHIKSIVLAYADSAVVNNKFGNVDALPVGFDLHMTELGVTVQLIDKAKTGGNLLVQSGSWQLFGVGAAAVNEITAWSGNSDAQVIVIPAGEFVTGGIRIGRGTPDRIWATVNDDLTGLDEFHITCFGERRYDVK